MRQEWNETCHIQSVENAMFYSTQYVYFVYIFNRVRSYAFTLDTPNMSCWRSKFVSWVRVTYLMSYVWFEMQFAISGSIKIDVHILFKIEIKF